MRIATVSVLLASLASTGSAQGWSITASAPVQGTASASVISMLFPSVSQSATLPVGPVAAGPFLVCAVTHPYAGASVQGSWLPNIPSQVGPLAFAAAAQWQAYAVFGSGPTFPNATLSAQIDLTLRAPMPVGGRLHLRVTGTGGWLQLDVGADGSTEFYLPGVPQADIPLHLLANGTVVRLTWFVQNVPTSPTTPQSMGLEAEFFPGEPVVATFDTTGMGTGLTAVQWPHQVLLMLDSGPTQTPLLLAFGAQPVNIPVLPTVTQLVTLDAIYATGAMTLPLPPLPSGFAIYCQGLVFDTWNNTFRSSNSVRALWP